MDACVSLGTFRAILFCERGVKNVNVVYFPLKSADRPLENAGLPARRDLSFESFVGIFICLVFSFSHLAAGLCTPVYTRVL